MGNKKGKSIDVALRKPKVSLEEILDYDSVISKARTGDQLLLQFLSSPENLHGMLLKIIDRYESPEKALRYILNMN